MASVIDKKALPNSFRGKRFGKIEVYDGDTSQLYGEYTVEDSDAEGLAEQFIAWLDDLLTGVFVDSVLLKFSGGVGRPPTPIALWIGQRPPETAVASPLETVSRMASSIGSQYNKLLEQTTTARAKEIDSLGKLIEISVETMETLKGAMTILIDDRKEERQFRLAQEIQVSRNEQAKARTDVAVAALNVFSKMIEAHLQNKTPEKQMHTNGKQDTPQETHAAKAKALYKRLTSEERLGMLRVARSLSLTEKQQLVRALIDAKIDEAIVENGVRARGSHELFLLIYHVAQLPMPSMIGAMMALPQNIQEVVTQLASYYAAARSATAQEQAQPTHDSEPPKQGG